MWVGTTLTGMAIAQHRASLSELALERERNARIEAERLSTVARLQMLQAQVEPHFLFNTLANVSSLIEVEPKQARQMLDKLTLLLRSALDSTRRSTTTLKKELDVIEAYLGVLKVRMGERLSYRIDASPDLLKLEVPAMLLQPIVENAVKHGIEPRVKGGTVRVEVKRENDSLVFIVADDGVGFMPNSKENIGLGAVRERLSVQFGDAASLTTSRSPDNWTSVIISIPMASSMMSEAGRT
jgi:sensor histidine kinase YesM